MTLIVGTLTEDSGSYRNTYSGSVTNILATYEFSVVNDTLVFINKGNGYVLVSVNGATNRVPPYASIRINDSAISGFAVISETVGPYLFDIVAIKLKNDIRDIDNLVTNAVLKTTGTTAQRPVTGLYIGFPYYDTTLGKPIWYNGTVWKDAAGTTV